MPRWLSIIVAGVINRQTSVAGFHFRTTRIAATKPWPLHHYDPPFIVDTRMPGKALYPAKTGAVSVLWFNCRFHTY